MNSKITSRIALLIENLGISKNQFSKKIGTSSALISQITTKQENFRIDIAQKIISTYPRLNANWLLNGSGEMWLENSENFSGLESDKKSGFYGSNDDNLNYETWVSGTGIKEVERYLKMRSKDHHSLFNAVYDTGVTANCLDLEMNQIVGSMELIIFNLKKDKTAKIDLLCSYMNDYLSLKDEFIDLSERMHSLTNRLEHLRQQKK